ncbi:MAG: hypothetical protein Q9160_001849 [Pyrenula sp. 1 TL-2023]
MSQWTYLIRFIAVEDGQIHLGQLDPKATPDVGLATLSPDTPVRAKLISGSAFDGTVTERTMSVLHLLSPLSVSEVSIIRCLGLNYRDHAAEAKMPIPNEPVLFVKPRTSLSGPHPSKIVVPKIAQDGSSDYEAELTFVIARDCKDVAESEAMNYVLGITCGNDVSARAQQFANSQWSFSKGFDYSAPIGPALVRPSALPSSGSKPYSLGIKAIHNNAEVQSSNTSEMIFTIQQTVAFLSQGTTLERGTVIMTGTPPGVGVMRNPKVVLKDGDDMRVWIEGVGKSKIAVHDRAFRTPGLGFSSLFRYTPGI